MKIFLIASVSLFLAAGAALAEVNKPDDNTNPYVQAILNAPDPSSTVNAYAQGLAKGGNEVTVHKAYVKKTAYLGRPDLAFRQAATVTQSDPNDGLAWGVLAYNYADRNQASPALTDIVYATRVSPEEPFVARTAGQLLAWYDSSQVNRDALPDQLRDDLAQVRVKYRDSRAFTDAYSDAALYYGSAPPAPTEPTYQPPEANVTPLEVPYEQPQSPVNIYVQPDYGYDMGDYGGYGGYGGGYGYPYYGGFGMPWNSGFSDGFFGGFPLASPLFRDNFIFNHHKDRDFDRDDFRHDRFDRDFRHDRFDRDFRHDRFDRDSRHDRFGDRFDRRLPNFDRNHNIARFDNSVAGQLRLNRQNFVGGINRQIRQNQNMFVPARPGRSLAFGTPGTIFSTNQIAPDFRNQNNLVTPGAGISHERNFVPTNRRMISTNPGTFRGGNSSFRSGTGGGFRGGSSFHGGSRMGGMGGGFRGGGHGGGGHGGGGGHR